MEMMIYLGLFLTCLGGRRLNYWFLSMTFVTSILRAWSLFNSATADLVLQAVEGLPGCFVNVDCLLQVKSLGQLKKHN